MWVLVPISRFDLRLLKYSQVLELWDRMTALAAIMYIHIYRHYSYAPLNLSVIFRKHKIGHSFYNVHNINTSLDPLTYRVYQLTDCLRGVVV